jgi:hypothetical protein
MELLDTSCAQVALPTTAAVEPCRFESSLLRFVPPLADREDISRIDKPEQQRLDLSLVVMARVHVARNRKAAYDAIATELRDSALQGYSAGSIKRDYLAFRASGWDWRVLVRSYKRRDLQAVADRSSLPPAFLKFWLVFAGTYTGGTRAAHTELERRWKAGEELDGFGSWMAYWQREYRGRPLPAVAPPLPPGLSYDNLLEKLPKGAELTVVREGFTAAKAELPIMRRDRSQLRALELVTFDDHPTNFRVVPDAARDSAKLLGLFALDVGCAYLAEHAAGARTITDAGVERSLTRSDGRGLLYQFLRRFGIPRHYDMHLLFERASFAIDQHDEDFLKNLSGGRIVIHRTNTETRRLLAGGPSEKVADPEGKGWIESWFNLFDRAASYLPAQAGSNPLTAKKGDIDSVEAEARSLLKFAHGLPPAIQSLLALPAMREAEAKIVLTELVNRLNARTNHRLQGFEPMLMWRLRDVPFENPWRPVAELPHHLRDVVEYDHVVESPAARFARLYRPEDFEPIPEAALVDLLDDKRTVSVARPYQIDVQIHKVQRTYTLKSPELEKAGAKFTAILDRGDLERIHLRNNLGAYVGTAQLWHGPSPIDREQVAEAARTIKRQRNALLGRAQELHKDRAIAEVQRQERSVEQLAGAVAELEAARVQLTPSEQAALDQAAPAPRRRSAKARQSDIDAVADLAREAMQQFTPST